MEEIREKERLNMRVLLDSVVSQEIVKQVMMTLMIETSLMMTVAAINDNCFVILVNCSWPSMKSAHSHTHSTYS